MNRQAQPQDKQNYKGVITVLLLLLIVTGLVLFAPMCMGKEQKSGGKRAEQVLGNGDKARSLITIEPDIPHMPAPQKHIVIAPTAQINVRIWTDRPSYRDGDPVQIFFRADLDSYVYIFDTDTYGVTRQIFPNYYDRDHFVHAGATYSIPDRGYSLTVAGPEGIERLEIVAVSRRPHEIIIYEQFDSRVPFPLREDGHQGFLKRIEGFSKQPPGISKKPLVKPSAPQKKSSLSPKGNISVRIGDREKSVRVETQTGRGSIVIEPNHPQHIPPPPLEPVLTARDATHFQVRARWGWHTPTRMGEIKVYSEPSRAKIWVNGRYIGHTSEEEKLPFGTYEIRVEKDGYFPEVQIIQVNSSERKRVRFILHRELDHRREPDRPRAPNPVPAPRSHPLPKPPPRR